jgi:HEPN domain-containing protein
MSIPLAKDYFARARARRDVVVLLQHKGMHADAVRESQELVELVLKGYLRLLGIDPPKVHDVGPFLFQYQEVLPGSIRGDVPRLAEISKALRRERESSFYGDTELIPSEEYGEKDSAQALGQVDEVLATLSKVEPHV